MASNNNAVSNSADVQKKNSKTNSPALKLNVSTGQPTKIITSEPHSSSKAEKKRRDKSDLGESFVAPDGGWGWFVAGASGVNILVAFALAQQFGIIFREHMLSLGITSSELTSIINTQLSVSAFTGLLNGPLFRRFSYRQVALVGSAITFSGLFLLVFAESFTFFICSYSCLYGLGRGLTISASSLAVNTYFKQKRRTATAYQFGVAGLGPIVCPYLATYLLYYFGVQGTVLIFSGLALHMIACSLIYQPVLWHVKKIEDAQMSAEADVEEEIIDNICEPETPSLPRANDGWFGSRTSLNTLRRRLSTRENNGDFRNQIQELKRLNSSEGSYRFPVSHSIEEEQPALPKDGAGNSQKEYESMLEELELAEIKRDKLPFLHKVVIFFDLELMRDITYVNLAVGLTLINFVEINFAVLTPFILSDFGFNNKQIALAMSSLGLCDLVIRFLIPMITANMKLGNKALFGIGIIGMCIGRAMLAYTRDFYVMFGIFIWLGLNKAFRMVFWGLIIPGYVPLKRLPAASGLQLLMSGVFSIIFGPVIGLIRDNTNYTFTLNVLNAICIFAVLMWILEAIIRKYFLKPRFNDGKMPGK